MRKMKKINGYLVVKFNDRELREWEGTALGKYGVIDAELYTGTLEVDRGAMEYDNADSIEEAVELARGLESELDTEEPEVKVTLIKETDEATEEEEVDAQKMIAGWENTLRGQVASPHYKDVDERTAAHELYGYKAALRDLGLLDREDCYVLPDTFGEAPGPLPKKPEELLSYVCDELCRHHLPEMTQEQLDAVCARCSLERLADEADEAELRIRTKAHRELNGLIADLRDARPGAEAGRLEHEARAYLRALAADCPDNDCRVYLNIFNGARELDAALDNLDAEGAPALALRKALRERVGELAEMFDGNFAVKQYRKEARS